MCSVLQGVTRGVGSGRWAPTAGMSGAVLALALTFSGTVTHAATLTTLYTFGGRNDGTDPSPGLVRDKSGAIYGVTYLGGINGVGTAFKLTPPAAGQTKWTETVIHDFGGYGVYPVSQIAIDKVGALYVTTYFGGASGNGALFKLTPPRSVQSKWDPKLLYSFGSAAGDVTIPLGIAVDDKGVVYGEAKFGGASGLGGVFAVAPPPAGKTAASESVLYSFTPTDGANYQGWLALGASGQIYGTSPNGGPTHRGLVYELTPPATPGGTWGHAVIHTFVGGTSDGAGPQQGVTIDPLTGTLYGATTSGGANGIGVAFSLTPPAPGKTGWAEDILYNFSRKDGFIGAAIDTLLVMNYRHLGLPITIFGVASNGDGHDPNVSEVFELEHHFAGGVSYWTNRIKARMTFPSAGWIRGPLLDNGHGVVIGLTRGDEGTRFGTIFSLTPQPAP